MRDIRVLALLAVVGFALAGCGSEKTTATTTTAHYGPTTPPTVTVVGTTTGAHMPTGTPIHCKHGPGAVVPPPGQGVAGNADGPNSSSEVRVIHRKDGSVVASCRSG